MVGVLGGALLVATIGWWSEIGPTRNHQILSPTAVVVANGAGNIPADLLHAEFEIYPFRTYMSMREWAVFIIKLARPVSSDVVVNLDLQGLLKDGMIQPVKVRMEKGQNSEVQLLDLGTSMNVASGKVSVASQGYFDKPTFR